MVGLRMKWPFLLRVVAIRAETLRKGTKEGSLKEGATIVESMGTRRLIVGTCKINKRRLKRKKERSRMIDQMLNVSNVKGWVIMPMNARMRKNQVGMKNMSPLQ